MLGNEAVTSGGRLNLARARREVDALAKRTGLAVPLDAITDELGVGDKQRLEYLRVLHRGAEALLLDEPTAVLTPLEANDLYATLRALADEGRTIVVVTHRLDEVVRFADRVTVMRRGKTVLSRGLCGGRIRRERRGLPHGVAHRRGGADARHHGPGAAAHVCAARRGESRRRWRWSASRSRTRAAARGSTA